MPDSQANGRDYAAQHRGRYRADQSRPEWLTNVGGEANMGQQASKGDTVLFNHTAVQIDLDHIGDAVELFTEVLGFEEVFGMANLERQPEPLDFRLLRQPAANVDLQLTGLPRIKPQERKIMNHYGFISDDAEADIATVAEWSQAKGFEFLTGLYMPRMFWIDVPQLFLDFVLEFMDGDELKKFPYPWPPTL